MKALQKLDEMLLPAPKIIYIVVCMVFYCLHLFRGRFIREYLALGDEQYGYIMAVMALVSFAFMTVWGTLADALGRHRLVLSFLCFALVASFELTALVAKVASPTARFYLSGLVMGLHAFFSCGLMPLTDHITLRLLSDRPGFSKDLYGRQRLWGTISYAGTNWIVGWFGQRYTVACVLYLWPIFSFICIVTLFILAPSDSPKPLSEFLSFLRRKPSSGTTKDMSEADGKEPKGSIVDLASPHPAVTGQTQQSPFLQLLTNGNYLFLLFVVFMTGSARAVMTHFLSKYWQEKMGFDDTQTSNAANFGVIMEVIIFFFGPWLLRIFGIYWLLIFGQLAMVVRCWAYVQIPASKDYLRLVYLVELLKGVAFGFTQASGVKLASEVAPKGLEATAQALYTSIYSQLPAVITALVGGHAYKMTHLLFQITAIVSTAALVLFVIKYILDGSIGLCGRRIRRQQSAAGTP